MARTQDNQKRRWTGKPWLARAIKLVVWATPIAVSILATYLLARLIPRPQSLAPAVAWFIAMAIVATAVLYLVDKLARRLLPLAALFQLSLVFPDRAPSRFKAALRTRTVHQLEERVAEIRASGLSDDPAIAAESLIELVADLSAHDRLTRGHAERVRAYSQIIGDEMKLKESEVELLQWAGLLHDVGKLFVPDEILNKPGRLTDEEFDIIKKHPEWGAELCEPLRGWLGEWVDAVGQHHERWDGKGYPAGLVGTEISLAARIVSVADVFDVITSVRSYKAAGGAEDARKELAACAGTQFDETIVRAFLNVSLGKLRLAMGPLAWLAQLPIIGRASLLPIAGTATSAAVAVSVMVGGGLFDDTHEYEPAPVEAAAPATTVESTVPVIVTTLAPPPDVTAFDTPIPETTVRASTVPASTVAPPTTTTSTTTTTTPVSSPPPTITTTTATTTTTPVSSPPPSTTTPTTTTTTTPVPSPIANDDVGTVAEGDFVDLDLGLNDEWVDSVVLLTAPASGEVTQLAPTVLRYQAVGDWYGVSAFTYEAVGASGSTATATVTVTVNNAPDAPTASDDQATTSEYATVNVDVLANDFDADGDALTISAVSAPSGLVVTDGISIDYSPTGESAGIHTLSYSVSDGTGLSDTGTVRVTVGAVNLAPVMPAIGDRAVDELSALSFTVTATDADLPADTITLSATGLPLGATFDPSTGAFTWTPTEAQGPSTYNITFTATDNGTGTLTDTETITITVTTINTPPALAAIGDRTVDELNELAFTVTASDADLPADTVTLSATGLPAGATFNPSTGAFAWTPTEAQGPGTYDVTFTATDNGTGTLTDTETITITVNAVNAAPVLSNPGDQTDAVGQVVNLPVVGVDPDVPANTLTFSATGLPTGLVIDPSTGVVSGTPTATGSGSVTITVTETNGVPTNLADSASFNWTINSPFVLISEIATSGAGGATDEFIELYNPTGAAVALDGWKILVSDGDDNNIGTITIPGGTTIQANEYYLIAHSSVAGALGADLAHVGNIPKGAGLSLTTDVDVTVDAVGTGPRPWKDGAGSLYGEGTYLPPLDGNLDQSYERRSGVGNCVDTDDNSADFFHNMTSRNPQASGTFEACGTPPPFVPPPPAGHVVISEFRFDGATLGPLGGGDNEFVEIFNPTPGPIDISGYRLYSQDGDLQAIVPALTILGSGRHLLFASASFAVIDGIAPDLLSAGGIRNGEGVYLEDAGGGLVDSVSTGGASGMYLEGTALPPISGRVIHSYERLVGSAGGNCVDTDDNAADFFHNLGSQNPQTSLDPAVTCAI